MPASRWGDDRYNPSLVTPVATIADLAGLPGSEGDTVRCMDPRFGGAGILYRHDGQRWTRGPIRKGNRARWTPFTVGGGDASTVTGSVRQVVLRAPTEFTRVRIRVANVTDAPITPIGRMNVAVSTNINSWSPSVGGDLTEDAATGWVTATAALGTIPARPGAAIGNGWTSTPWVEIRSRPADDGGRPWLFIRYALIATGTPFRGWRGNVNPLDQSGSESYTRTVTNADYSFMTTASAAGGTAFNGATTQFNGPVFIVDFATEKDFESVDLVGASTIAWVTVGSDYDLPFARVANKAALAMNMTFTAFGNSGANTSDIYQDALRVIADSYSRYMVYPVFSSNDPGGFQPSNVRRQVQRALSIRAQAREAGKECALLILNHDGSQDGGANQAARDLAISDLYASGAPILDARPVIGRAENQNLWIPEYTSDGIHTTYTGRDVLAAWLPREMARVITLDAVP